MGKSQSLVARSITSTGWNIIASIAKIVVLFVRSIALARLLPVELFGVYAFAGSIVVLTAPFAQFGMGGAFLHRTLETQDEQYAAAVHLTLKSIFTLVWSLVLILGALLFTQGQDRTALLALTVFHAVIELTQTPRMILNRRVTHRRLALVDLVETLLSASAAVILAWYGADLWALLVIDLVIAVVRVILLYLWKPVWRPRLAWSRSIIQYYLRFGKSGLVSALLMKTLDRVDDLWAGAFLGKIPLSYYTRAYSFATYPRTILAAPLNTVAGGTYAELKEDRIALSRAFFRVNALLLRTGFFMGGLLAVIAPEFIRLVLGSKWLPMLEAFRLMLVFTLLDPIKMTIAHLFVAVGKPEQVVKARLVQLVTLLVGLFVMGTIFGINGVAIAVNGMLVLGIGILLREARRYVDFSLVRLFLAPFLALMSGIVFSAGTLSIIPPLESDWWNGGIKGLTFVLPYLGMLFLVERERSIDMIRVVLNHFGSQIGAKFQ